jgi:hypothetical protein
MYRAPACASIRGTIRYWSDHQRRIERLQRPGQTTRMVITSGGDPPSRESTVAVWLSGDRLRVEQHGMITITMPPVAVQYSPGQGAIRRPLERAQPFEHPRWLWAPRPLIDAIDIAAIDIAERLGRAVWRVSGTADGADRLGLFPLVLGGDHYRFDVDQATGAVLAMHVSLDDGETLDDIAWTSFEPDVGIDDDVFELALPAGERIRSINELRLERLAAEGVDVSGIDPDDDAAVNAMLQGRSPWRSTLDPLAEFVATGPPPTDEHAARASIEAAFREIGDRDGDRLVHVQAGEGLAPFLDQARERVPGELRAQKVKFLRGTEAVVTVAIERADGSAILAPQTLRAVVERGEWKVERTSLTSLLRMAGVRCPPPPEPGGVR